MWFVYSSSPHIIISSLHSIFYRFVIHNSFYLWWLDSRISLEHFTVVRTLRRNVKNATVTGWGVDPNNPLIRLAMASFSLTILPGEASKCSTCPQSRGFSTLPGDLAWRVSRKLISTSLHFHGGWLNLPEANKQFAPENRQSQKERIHLPTSHFQGLSGYVSFREGNYAGKHTKKPTKRYVFFLLKKWKKLAKFRQIQVWLKRNSARYCTVDGKY